MKGCRGICERLSVHDFAYHEKKYDAGLKRCTICEQWFELDDNRCPCCHSLLRTKSQNKKVKIETIKN
tara:strand:- start:3094 stop:3297 length:204 start_codon:yes stop_codon:yes gene_type:complete